MKLFEIEMPLLYLHSNREHAPGKMIHPENSAYPLGAKIEGWLERGRPSHRLSRQNSIYLLEHGHGSAQNVYAVKPIGLIERGNTGWLKMLGSNSCQDQPLIDEWIANYWAGTDCPTVPGAWEYRAEMVRIVRLVGGQAMRRLNEPYDWMKAV